MNLKIHNKEIYTSIDEDDLDFIKLHNEKLKFHLIPTGIFLWSCIQKKNVYLHRLIMRVFEHTGTNVDHIDCDILNNKKSNLRFLNFNESNFNRRKLEKCTSKYKGVSWRKDRKKWKVYISDTDGKSIFGGNFLLELDAAKKANELIIKYHGKSARLNILEDCK